jgi:hypothetical protein
MRIFWGVMAKTSRAIEHLETLHGELQEFRQQPRPYAFVVTSSEDRTRHTFQLHPSWESETTARWAAIVGETVHNLRSALDHLIWECARLSGGDPGIHTAFPLRGSAPEEGFAAWATAAPTRTSRAGKLYGLSEEAVSLVERFQPYRGTEAGELLAQIDSLWQIDKHRMPLPLMLLGEQPTLALVDCELVDRSERREEGALVIEVNVSVTGPDPTVDVHANAPFDIAFDDRLVLDHLRNAAVLVIQMREPFEDLFPDQEDLEMRQRRDAFDAMVRQSNANLRDHSSE